MDKINGENLDITLDEIFKDDTDTSTPLVTPEKKVELTEAMTKRINEVRTKTEAAVRDSMAEELGFASYEELLKSKDKTIITEAGYDPDEIEKIIGPLLEKRLANDPRMQRLAEYEEQNKKTSINAELGKLEKLTGLKVKETDLSQETLDLMGKGVPLAQAYIATNSIKIIGANKGSTEHMANSTSTGQTKVRGMTQDEKAFYKSINPYATDEELNKKTIEVK